MKKSKYSPEVRERFAVGCGRPNWNAARSGRNNSLKPNLLCSTNNMEKKLAMLLAPLRKSA
jgi:hypothetical protein